MKRPRIILYFFVVFGLFHVALLIGTIFVNYKRNVDFLYLTKFLNHTEKMIWMAVVGVILFLVNLLIFNIESRQRKKFIVEQENEINTLKAKLYDIQEASGSAAKPVEPPHEGEDKSEESEEDNPS